jgi:uncharacterized protein (DUF58 family)
MFDLQKKLDRSFRRSPHDPLSLKLAQSRIYLLPTRRGWAFVGLIAVLLLLALNYAASLVFLLAFLLAGYLVANVVFGLQQLNHLSVDLLPVKPVFAGEALRFEVRLSEPKQRLRSGLQLTQLNNASNLTTLAEGGNETVSLMQVTSQRGLQSLGRVSLESTAPAGLIRAWTYIHAEWQGLVYPKAESPAPPAPFVPLSQTEQAKPRSRVTQQGLPELSGLKPYQAGDSPKHIAWQRLARGAELASLAFAHEEGQGQSLALDYATCGAANPEARLSRLCAWVLQAQASDAAFSLQLPGASLDKGSGEAQVQTALSLLAKASV